mmetsp:Transcript_79875/g.213528  ORF Transcript_79875/g.213528 Transcript_79875/m.213528 type:complete len:288 (+) Transcript_79875:1366-2229(+)
MLTCSSLWAISAKNWVTKALEDSAMLESATSTFPTSPMINRCRTVPVDWENRARISRSRSPKAPPSFLFISCSAAMTRPPTVTTGLVSMLLVWYPSLSSMLADHRGSFRVSWMFTVSLLATQWPAMPWPAGTRNSKDSVIPISSSLYLSTTYRVARSQLNTSGACANIEATRRFSFVRPTPRAVFSGGAASLPLPSTWVASSGFAGSGLAWMPTAAASRLFRPSAEAMARRLSCWKRRVARPLPRLPTRRAKHLKSWSWKSGSSAGSNIRQSPTVRSSRGRGLRRPT